MKFETFDPPELIPFLYRGIGGKTAWDIGCSVGNIMTGLMAKFDNVVGFEPSSIAHKYLDTVPPIMGARVLKLAISDHEGKVELNLEEGHVRVPCRSIDSLTMKLDMPDFIKVDVVGHEVKVLKGAEFTMITRAPDWLIEIYSASNGQEVQSFLSAFGYRNTLILDPNDRDPLSHYWIRATIARLDG